jgi:hypothetical protein
MTAGQFARAVQADERWVQNAIRLLGRPVRRTVRDAQWLGLVRLLHRDFGVPLVAAGAMATTALAAPPTERAVPVARSGDDSVMLIVDVARYRSSFAAALSAALVLGGPRRRGRRPARTPHDPIRAARDYGVDVDLLASSLALTPAQRLARLDADREFLSAVRPVAPARAAGTRSGAPHAVRRRTA